MGYPGYAYGEVSRRGKEIYERDMRARVEERNNGKYLVLDIESGDYEIDESHIAASRRAHAKHPDGVFFGMRIGYRALAKVGGSLSSIKE